MCYLLEGQPLDAGRESFLLAQGSFRKCRSYGDVSSVSSDCEGGWLAGAAQPRPLLP